MNNILQFAEKCTGCSACMNVCTKRAIMGQTDEAGFWYPQIQEHLCVNCGKCVAVCPVEESYNGVDTRRRAFYGAMTNEETVKKSSSGGAFTLMAEYVLSKNGLVCGAVMDYKSGEAVYMSTDNCTMDALRRSKYIASLPREIFRETQEALNNGRLVLFCGLPCHIHGLKRFLKTDMPNLIVCDFICGGTASPKFFREHLVHLEKKYGAPVTDVNFRAKLNGWKEHSIKISFANGKSYGSVAFFDSFFKGYFEKPYQRNSCYHCNYRLNHRSDVIIADYWDGLRKGRTSDLGTSMVITNSEKGDKFFYMAMEKQEHNFIEMPLEDSDYVFKTETERYTRAYKTKQQFLVMYQKYGFEKAARKTYFKGAQLAKLKKWLAKYLPRGTKYKGV